MLFNFSILLNEGFREFSQGDEITVDCVDDKIIIKDGFLMVHDVIEHCWHCYNINHVTHFHYPDYMRGPAK